MPANFSIPVCVISTTSYIRNDSRGKNNGQIFRLDSVRLVDCCICIVVLLSSVSFAVGSPGLPGELAAVWTWERGGAGHGAGKNSSVLALQIGSYILVYNVCE